MYLVPEIRLQMAGSVSGREGVGYWSECVMAFSFDVSPGLGGRGPEAFTAGRTNLSMIFVLSVIAFADDELGFSVGHRDIPEATRPEQQPGCFKQPGCWLCLA